MIRSRIGVRDTFGDRLRSSRQRLRRDGRKFTQGDLAKAVGVERNTVSRWENGGMLPKDPTVIASLADVLGVTADWLIGGDRPARGSHSVLDRIHEGSGVRRVDSAAGELPDHVGAVVNGYLARLRVAGCSDAQIAGVQDLLLSAAYNNVSAIALNDRTDEQLSADVDAAWDLVVRILRRDGIRL